MISVPIEDLDYEKISLKHSKQISTLEIYKARAHSLRLYMA